MMYGAWEKTAVPLLAGLLPRHGWSPCIVMVRIAPRPPALVWGFLISSTYRAFID